MQLKSDLDISEKKIYQWQSSTASLKPWTKCDFRAMPRLHNNSGALNLPLSRGRGEGMNGLFNPFCCSIGGKVKSDCCIAPSVALCADENFLWQKAALILSFLAEKGSVLMLFLCCQIPSRAKRKQAILDVRTISAIKAGPCVSGIHFLRSIWLTPGKIK